MPRIFKHLEAGCLQVNLMSTSAQINQLKYTIYIYIKNNNLSITVKILRQLANIFTKDAEEFLPRINIRTR